MSALAFTAGVIVVVLTWGAILATFVLPRGRSVLAAPSRVVMRVVRAVFVAAVRPLRSYAAKDAVLAGIAPVALLVQLATILGLFVLGFACIDLWAAGSFAVALDQAGAGVFTLGLARVAGGTNDAVIVLAAASGAIAIALQIGYLPTIYQSFARRESLVTLMESRAGIPAWGPEVLMRHQLVATIDALPELYRSWEQWSAEVAESHTTQPVLILFRSPQPGYSWILGLLAILDAAAMHLAVAPSSAPSEARLCLRMGFTALRRLSQSMGWPVVVDPQPDQPIDLDEASFAQAVAQLERFGFPVERSAGDAWEHFHGWRVNYEAAAYRFADYLLAPHAPWSGPRHHLPEAIVLPDRPPHRSPGGDQFSDAAFRDLSE